jgi:hypothetical protein
MDSELKALIRELVTARAVGGPIPESPVAVAAAKREYERDPNRTDRKHTQDRMDAEVHVLRVRMGLEKD